MPTKDFPPRPQGAEPDSVQMLNWLDALGNRQSIDAQQELTSVASGDEVLVFDVSETGNVKTKKATITNIIAGVIVPLANGGTGVALTDPNADRIMFWDDSAGAVTWLTAGTGLSIAGTTITASATGDVSGPGSSTDNAAVRFDSTTGKLIQNSAFIIDDSGNVSSFGGNIKFPATQSASADANTLDDYEEGTFTPVVTFGGGSTGITYSNQAGRYTKIGRAVCISAVTSLTSKGSSTGAALITGLPFTSSGTGGEYVPVNLLVNALAVTSVSQILADVVAAASDVRCGRYSAGTFTQLTDGDFTNTTLFELGGSYFA